MYIKIVMEEDNKLTSLYIPSGHPLCIEYEPNKTIRKDNMFVYSIDPNHHFNPYITTDWIIDYFHNNMDICEALRSWIRDYPNRNTFEIWECTVGEDTHEVKYSISLSYLLHKKISSEEYDEIKKFMDSQEKPIPELMDFDSDWRCTGNYYTDEYFKNLYNELSKMTNTIHLQKYKCLNTNTVKLIRLIEKVKI